MTFPGVLITFGNFTMEPGFLVEFFEEKRLLLAVVLELKGERLHVLTETNRELTLARKRVLSASPSRLSVQLSRQKWLDSLKEIAAQREALKATVQLPDLWELLSQENQPLEAAEMAELWFNGDSPDQVAAMGRALYEDRYYFKYKDGRWLPNQPEAVEQLHELARREEEAKQELETAAAWLRTAWEGGDIADPLWRTRLVALLKQMAVHREEAPDYDQGKAFLEKARLSPGEAPFALLVRLGVFSSDENLDLYRLEVPREFSLESRGQVEALVKSPSRDPFAAWRVDLTHLEAVTIDGERTRDFDDALSLEVGPDGWRLGIHISDVSSFLDPHTPLDLEAQERGTSIYLPEHRLPMLPEELSEDTMSLMAQQERLALSFLVTLSPEAEVEDWTIVPSRLRVARRLSYQEVDQMLTGNGMLATLSRLMEGLKERRLAAGGYELKLPEVWVFFNNLGEPQVMLEDQETPSRELVAEAMVLANWLAARFLVERGIPAIFRTQTEPREPIRRDEPKGLLELWQDRRRLSRMIMDLDPQPHWGLGLPYYTMASSPIRRYLDLVIHRQILGVIAGKPPAYGRDDLEKILMAIEPAMRRAAFLKNRRLRYWLLKYLALRVGQKKEALVVECLPNRCRLLFPDLLLEAMFPAPTSLRLRPGDLVQVRLDRVLPREDQLKLSLA